MLEANHDIHMLEVGGYPYYLKRILENVDTSNELSGQFLGRLLHDNFKSVILGHLSKENNHPELAYETVRLKSVWETIPTVLPSDSGSQT